MEIVVWFSPNTLATSSRAITIVNRDEVSIVKQPVCSQLLGALLHKGVCVWLQDHTAPNGVLRNTNPR